MLSCVNASFDNVWIRNVTVHPAILWECSIRNASVVKENVRYSTIYNLCCTIFNVSDVHH